MIRLDALDRCLALGHDACERRRRLLGERIHERRQHGEVAAQFPFRVQNAQIEYGVGKRFPDGLVRRFAGGLTLLDRRYGVTVPEPNVAIAFPGGAEELKLRWLSGRVTFWKPHYIERRGIELFDPVEDFDVGSLVSMESGLVMRMLGSS